jgi:hypothetical protein
MKHIIIAMAAALSCAAFAQGQHYVAPHMTRNGTFVEGHFQTNPDSSLQNNWSTQGNVNPYTGQAGTVNPYQYQQPSYPQPQINQGSMYQPYTGGMYQMPGRR